MALIVALLAIVAIVWNGVPARALTRSDVAHALGDEEDTAITAILALNPTYGEFHTALAWALGESDVMGEERRPLDGKAKQIYDILAADEIWLKRSGLFRPALLARRRRPSQGSGGDHQQNVNRTGLTPILPSPCARWPRRSTIKDDRQHPDIARYPDRLGRLDRIGDHQLLQARGADARHRPA
jgi:hypothetical protein